MRDRHVWLLDMTWNIPDGKTSSGTLLFGSRRAALKYVDAWIRGKSSVPPIDVVTVNMSKYGYVAVVYDAGDVMPSGCLMRLVKRDVTSTRR